MNENNTDEIIQKFMHPTVYTGVKPLFLVAEELPTKDHTGDIIDAVWVYWNDEEKNEFSYITKFAVEGKIIDRNYHTAQEMEPFKGRLALATPTNLEKMVLHKAIKKEIEDVKAIRNSLSKYTQKDFENLSKIVQKEDEVSLFKRAHGDWLDPFYEINIDTPYQIIEIEDNTLGVQKYKLKHPRTREIRSYLIEDEFYAYIIGGKADIAGLQLKDERYKQKIEILRGEEKQILASIEWLFLKDNSIKSIKEKLPRHPFDDYFVYAKKGSERKFEVPENLVKALEIIIGKYMPDLINPMGEHYIPVDNLLYLFHEIIPRIEALRALEVCDIINEPSTLILGLEGQRELPPKFLVSVTHIAYAYKKFPNFIETCEDYLRKNEL